MQPIMAMTLTAIIGIPSLASGQSLLTSRSFGGFGLANIYGAVPGAPSSQIVVELQSSFVPGVAQFTVTPTGGSPILATYSVLDFPFPLGNVSVSFLIRSPTSAGNPLPQEIVLIAVATTDGISVVGIGSISGTSASGYPLDGSLFLQMTDASTPPPPPPTLSHPSFDGTILRVPAVWNVRKFQGWAPGLAQEYGTLTGGETATVPASWRNGVMQCHGTQGFIYELPLHFNYTTFIGGMILYTPPGTWPSWERADVWRQVAATSQVTKYAYAVIQ